MVLASPVGLLVGHALRAAGEAWEAICRVPSFFCYTCIVNLPCIAARYIAMLRRRDRHAYISIWKIAP
jgi:hypothetical protein